MNQISSILWFKQDLRLSCNAALDAAMREGACLPIYVWDQTDISNVFQLGESSKVWLVASLASLNDSLGDKLNVYRGNTVEIVRELIHKYSIKNIFWNTSYEPWYIKRENEIKVFCQAHEISCKAYLSNYISAPEEILKDDGSSYKIFTAYKNKFFSLGLDKKRTDEKSGELFLIENVFVKDIHNKTSLTDLKLCCSFVETNKLKKKWQIGEEAAQEKYDSFLKDKITNYGQKRDLPADSAHSRLSPHLHFGEISPRQIFDGLEKIKNSKVKQISPSAVDAFMNELIWREYAAYVLYHFPGLPEKNFKDKFNNFLWEKNEMILEAWKAGKTGYPFVDAGMRELLETGYMHNRVRMIVASFLVKNLGIHWHEGRDWFWQQLVDADLANNSMNWQWVAGTGFDTSPFFRIFNPITQGKKFDPEGLYTKKFIPELKDLPVTHLFSPWKAPRTVLQAAGVTLGVTYPKPIIDLENSRKKALAKYRSIR